MFVVRYLYCQICQCILTFADIIVFTSFGREQRLLFEEGWEQKIKEEDTNAIWKKSRIISYFTDLYQNTEKTQFFCKNNKKKMLCQFDLNKFWNERVGPRKQAASSKLRDTMAILTELLRVSRTSRPWNPNFDLGCGAARTKICWHAQWSWRSDWRAPIFVTHRDWVDSLFESNGRFQSSRRWNAPRLCCTKTKDSFK